MARPLRIEFPGGLYHVTSRGDRGEAIFLCDPDRAYWLDLLGEVCTRHNWLCHAYCLMDNHFHIVVETIEGNLSAGMRQFNGVYTQWHNRSVFGFRSCNQAITSLQDLTPLTHASTSAVGGRSPETVRSMERLGGNT